MMDMDDALGQENLKTTLIADQGADVILQTANQMENQVAVSTPGSNPYLTAQAQVANLRCQAYMQKMLAAELRQEAGRIAHDNVLVKRRTTATGGINSLITGALTADKENRHDGPKEKPEQVAQAILLAAKAQSVAGILRSRRLADRQRTAVLRRPWYRPSLLKIGGRCSCRACSFCRRARTGSSASTRRRSWRRLSKMQSLMNTYIAAPLKTINQYEQSVAKYEQQVMYPLRRSTRPRAR